MYDVGPGHFVLLAGAPGYAVWRWSRQQPGRAPWGYLGTIVMVVAIGIFLVWLLPLLAFMLGLGGY